CRHQLALDRHPPSLARRAEGSFTRQNPLRHRQYHRAGSHSGLNALCSLRITVALKTGYEVYRSFTQPECGDGRPLPSWPARYWKPDATRCKIAMTNAPRNGSITKRAKPRRSASTRSFAACQMCESHDEKLVAHTE